ncbi:hypothetical protein ACWDDN_48225 [Streptomyces griseoruber]
MKDELPSDFLLTTVEQAAGWVRKASIFKAPFGLACCAIELMDAILKLHQKIQSSKLGVNAEEAARETEEAALKALPTIEMKGLLR